MDPLSEAAFEMPADALPPLQYIPPERSLAVSARNWGAFDGYRLIALDAEAIAAEEIEAEKVSISCHQNAERGRGHKLLLRRHMY